MTKSDYVTIEEEEFEEFLLREYGKEEVTLVGDARLTEEGNFSNELVYAISVRPGVDRGENTVGRYEGLQVRVFSTIDKRTGESRDKGEDAIRTVLWDTKESRPIAGRSHTKRISTWRENLKPKIDKLRSSIGEVTIVCDRCGNWMVKREGQYGEFLGCLNYPDCDNTEKVPEGF